MRVIAGKAKGHKLETIEGLATRPTTDRIKETLFNIIAFDLPECRFLDLFAGSGAIGIEALSRGASKAVFVEQAPECVQVILSNLRHTKLMQNAELLSEDVFVALDSLAKDKYSFDIIFMDPPYAAGLAEPVLQKIAEAGLLAKDGYLIMERSSEIPLSLSGRWQVLREKVYKKTILTFLSLEEEIL